MASKDAATLRRAVEALDRPDRMLVLLRFADGLTTYEIAEVLRQPEAEVSSRLDALCRSLRAALMPTSAGAVAAA